MNLEGACMNHNPQFPYNVQQNEGEGICIGLRVKIG